MGYPVLLDSMLPNWFCIIIRQWKNFYAGSLGRPSLTNHAQKVCGTMKFLEIAKNEQTSCCSALSVLFILVTNLIDNPLNKGLL